MLLHLRRQLLLIQLLEPTHALRVISEDSPYVGKYFICKAYYDGQLVVAGVNWSLVSGSQYATINETGRVDIEPGTIGQTIVIQASAKGLTTTKTMVITFDNDLSIDVANTITGTSGNAIARYNDEIVYNPQWAIVSGSEYGTINALGEITITASGTMVISATYNGYTTTKSIELIYNANTETHTHIDPDTGTTTTTTTTTETDPSTGETTVTETTTVTQPDGYTSETTSTTVENQDGSSTTSSNTVNSDGTTSTTEANTSAPDPETGSTTSQSTTTNYDENGDVTGSSETTGIQNTDGSSSSSTTNYNAEGDPTSGNNQQIDTEGNNSTQELEYDSEGNSTVTGYDIDTSENPSGEKTFNGDGVNTEFYAFDVTRGFIMKMHFTIDFTKQPAGQDENHHNILTMKRATPEPWYGFQLRQSNTNKIVILGTQFATGNNTNTNITPGNQITSNIYEYDIEIVYDPTLPSNQFVARELLGNTTIISASKTFPDLQELRYLTVCIGHALDANGDPYRYSNIDVYNFSIQKLSNEVAEPVIACDGKHVTITCETPNTTIYYRLNETGEFAAYTASFTISQDTIVEAYAEKNGVVSETVSEYCEYDAVEDPVIYCDGEHITLNCETPSADIYYRLNQTGSYILYESPIEIFADTIIEAYAELDGKTSEVVSETCIYEPSTLVAPEIHCDGKYVTITCATPSSSIYYRLNQEGSFAIYTTPIELSADTVVEAYSYLDGETSAVVILNCIYDPTHDYSRDYLTLDILTSGTVKWNSIGSGSAKTVEYSINDGLWTTVTASSSSNINVVAGDKIRFRGTNASYAKDKSNYSGFEGGTATFNVYGNMMSLIYGDNFIGQTAFNGGTYNFCSMFKLSNVISAENLIFPATTLTTYCYRAMFSKATSLTTAPAILPATTLSQGCYYYMFEECPFTDAPELPATDLVNQCYYYTFINCTNLNYVKCMAVNNINATNCNSWLKGVAATGTFVKDSAATWGTGISAIPTGWTVYNDNALVAPTINYDGEQEITLTCDTYGADIYYNLNQTRSYTLYTEPILIDDDVTIECYSEKNGQTSTPVTESCAYVEEVPFTASNQSISNWKYNNVPIETPYSINAIDGHSSNYSKGTFTFESTVSLRHTLPTYLWFQHADQSADIYVNDVKVETHWGGYNAFFSDITNYAHRGTNKIRVDLCNTTRQTLAPAAGDFNFNATLGNAKCFSSTVLPAMNYGYDGFHVTSTVSQSQATIYVKTNIPTGAEVVCTITGGSYTFTDTLNSTGLEMTFTAVVNNPHLWNGTADPFLYNIKLEIYKDNILYHRFERPYGLRYYSYVINDTTVLQSGDPYTGFLLNGSPYLLRGVCMHHDVDGKANALKAADITNEFNIIQELGCNFLRLAHYPHTKEVYDMCDQLGIIVQTEVPCVNKLQSTMPTDYYDHLTIQYQDMVNQHYNHPCIMFWGLSNETTTDDKAFGKAKIEQYTTLIKSLDSERLVGYVMSHSYANPYTYYNSPNGIDWLGCNIYVGWYIDKASNDPTNQLNTRVTNIITNAQKALAFSEYGAGGTQHCHSEDPQTTTTKGNYERHDIEYQMWLHEGHIAAIRNYPQLLFTAEWQLFDIAVSNRNEGYTVCLDGETTSTDDNLRRLNNKGLVERDHITKKDTFYIYKAEWNPTPFVHICGKDYKRMTNRVIKCYTNAGSSLDLYVNGTFVETTTVTDHIALFTSATYQSGDIIRVDGPNSTSDTFTFE